MARGNSEQQGYGLNNASYTLKDNCNLYFNLSFVWTDLTYGDGCVSCINKVVFNICVSSLFCFPTCFISINPERGTKVERTKATQLHVNPKVLTLIQDLSDHEWRAV